MKRAIDLQEYLEFISGEEMNLTSFDAMSKLPLYLCGYQFLSGKFSAETYIFAIAPQKRLTPHQYFTQWKKIEETLQVKVILVFESLISTYRNRLFQLKVPFIVPGIQFFLPPEINFRERIKRSLPDKDFLPFPAQLLIIRELLFHDISGNMQKDIAGKTGYTPMSISIAMDSLQKSGFCCIVQHKKSKIVHFNLSGKKLWTISFPLMRSPIRKVFYNALNPKQLPLAGISALSEMSMLSPDQLPVYAGSNQTVKDPNVFRFAECEDFAQSKLEIWQYQPIRWQDKCVDPLSLSLSLKSEDDPRVEGCLEEMMESLKW